MITKFTVSKTVLPEEDDIPEDVMIHVEINRPMKDNDHKKFQEAARTVFDNLDFMKIDIDDKTGLLEVYPKSDNMSKNDIDLNDLLNRLPEVLKNVWSEPTLGSIQE